MLARKTLPARSTASGTPGEKGCRGSAGSQGQSRRTFPAGRALAGGGAVLQEVAGVELNAGHIRSNFHNAPALGVICSRERALRALVDAEIMVVAVASDNELIVVLIYIPADSFHLSEIECRAGDISYLAGRYAVLIMGV